ncbi:MAG: TonB-dependent receptor plug domain-containing protein, partial [Cyanobacteria bacterium P01_H01_bin.105]
MRQLYLLKSLWLAGLSWIFLCQVVIAESVVDLATGVPAVDALNNQEATLEWMSQTPTSDTDELEEEKEKEEEEEEEDTLRIVVTAEKTPEVVQDVPISLTVLTEDELEDADITSLDGIAGNTPNFSSFSATGSRSFTFYSIRGLSNQNFGSRDPVAFYVDDIPYDYGSFIDLDLPDLQQVEILRGPQNTLYGRSSQAGVVNITTRKPTNEFSFNSTAGYGSEENLDLRAGVSG